MVFVAGYDSSAQKWNLLGPQWYDHIRDYDFKADTIVAIKRNIIHPKDIICWTIMCLNGERAYFLVSESPNECDLGIPKIFLGTDAQSALQTIKDFHTSMSRPEGMIDTIPNDGYICFHWAKEDPKYGKLLVMRRVNDGGTVTLDERMFWMLEDALSNFDESTLASFPHLALDSKEEIEAEIKSYKERLELTTVPAPRKEGPLYTDAFAKLFRQRIKEYKADLRAMRRK